MSRGRSSQSLTVTHSQSAATVNSFGPTSTNLSELIEVLSASFLRSFVCSFVPSFLPSFLRSFVCSFLRSFVRSFVRSFGSLLPLPCFLSLSASTPCSSCDNVITLRPSTFDLLATEEGAWMDPQWQIHQVDQVGAQQRTIAQQQQQHRYRHDEHEAVPSGHRQT